MKKILLIFILLGILHSSFSQNFLTIDQKNFIKKGDIWYVQNKEINKDYAIDNKTITLKFKQEFGSIDKGLSFLNTIGIPLKEVRRNKLGYIDLEIPTGTDVFTLYSELSKIPIVEKVEINTIGEYCYSANDTYYSQQWHINKIKANLGWDFIGGDRNIIIAILDCGTDWTHEDIGLGSDNYQNIWLNPNEDDWTTPNTPNTGNGIDNDNNGFIDDWKGWDFAQNDNDSRGPLSHGTIVAGIAAAKTNNNRGVAGVAGGLNNSGVRLMILNVGHYNPLSGVLDDAITYAAHNGADIIQMSLEAEWSQAIVDAIEDAYHNHGVVLVCASGNYEQGESSSVKFPANNPHVISVGATTQNDGKSSFSCYGSTMEIAAPGENIYTTTLNNSYVGNNNNGTSLAAPQVSATAALLLSISPSLTPDSVRSILRSSSEKVGGYNYNSNPNNPGHSPELGYGRLNVSSAISKIYPTISGPSLVCASNTDFYLSNYPYGSSTNWTKKDNLSIANSTETECTVYSNGNGNGWVQASISNGNFYPLIIRIEPWVGVPPAPTTYPTSPIYENINSIFSISIVDSPQADPSTGYWEPYGCVTLNGSNSGSMASFYSASDDGTGTIYVSTSNACGTLYKTAITVITGNGGDCGVLPERAETPTLSISPNPANDYLSISFRLSATYEKNMEFKIRIYDSFSRLVKQFEIFDSYAKISVTDLQVGTYFVVINGFKVKLEGKFIIQR